MPKGPRTAKTKPATGASYSAALGKGYRLIASSNLQTATGGFEDPLDARVLQGYLLVDGRLALQRGPWRVSVFGRNLFDRRYRVQQVQLNDYYNELRIIGAELRLRY